MSLEVEELCEAISQLRKILSKESWGHTWLVMDALERELQRVIRQDLGHREVLVARGRDDVVICDDAHPRGVHGKGTDWLVWRAEAQRFREPPEWHRFLDAEQIAVMRLLLGVGHGRTFSRKAVATILETTVTRVRQVERSALEALKRASK